MANARKMVDEIVRENRTVYGITTGFGKFARTVIPKDKLKCVSGFLTQLNLPVLSKEY